MFWVIFSEVVIFDAAFVWVAVVHAFENAFSEWGEPYVVAQSDVDPAVWYSLCDPEAYAFVDGIEASFFVCSFVESGAVVPAFPLEDGTFLFCDVFGQLPCFCGCAFDVYDDVFVVERHAHVGHAIFVEGFVCYVRLGWVVSLISEDLVHGVFAHESFGDGGCPSLRGFSFSVCACGVCP